MSLFSLCLSTLWLWADKRAKYTIIQNLTHCFPEKTPQECQTLMDQHVTFMTQAFKDMLTAFFASPNTLQSFPHHIMGLEHLPTDKGTLLLSLHHPCLELAGRLFSLHHPICATYRPHPKTLIDRGLYRWRRPFYDQLISRHAIRDIIRALETGHTLFYAADMVPEHKPVFAPWFGQPTATLSTFARYARLGNANIALVYYYRSKESMNIIVEPTPLPLTDPNADATWINNRLEHIIRAHPEQYLWSYKRLKSPAPGYPSIYEP